MLMKKIVLLIIFASLSLFNAFSFSKAEKITAGEVKRGYIKIFGNEPFTNVGFKTPDGEEYTLLADKDVLSILREKQGFLLEISGQVRKDNEEKTFHFQMLKDGFFELESWEVIELD